MNENTNPSKRREWVKNAAIIFLSIMLVLTFFSNTIMNYSLPEVATEYVQNGTITEKVRGTGNLEATDPYNVVVTESRKIESVNVKNGDEVEKDAVLFYLEDVESEELKTAQKELDDLRLAYLTGLFTGDITSDVINKLESGKTGSLASYQAQLADIDNRLTAAKNSLDSATANQQNVQNNLNNLTGQKNINDATVVDTTGEQQAVNSAAATVANAEAEVARIKNEITGVQAKIDEAVNLLGTPVADENGNVRLKIVLPTSGVDSFYGRAFDIKMDEYYVPDNYKAQTNMKVRVLFDSAGNIIGKELISMAGDTLLTIDDKTDKINPTDRYDNIMKVLFVDK